MQPVQGPPVAAAEYLEVHLESPLHPIVVDGGVSSLLIPVVHYHSQGLADVEWEVVAVKPGCHDNVGAVCVCGHAVMCEQGVLRDKGVDSQCGCQRGCDGAYWHCLVSDGQDGQYSVPGGAIEPKVTKFLSLWSTMVLHIEL